MTEAAGSGRVRDLVPPSAAVEIGVARRDITPPAGIYARNWGAAAHDVAEGVHKPLNATALVMRADEQDAPLVLVSLELGWWQRGRDEALVRRPVLDRLGLDPARVMIACVHTHAGPSTCLEDLDKPGGDAIAAYVNEVGGRVVEAVREAMSRMAAGTLTFATGKCALATNRDLYDPEAGRVVCGFNPDETADDTLLVGRATDAAGRQVATLVNYACHPTTLAWDNRLISPDYIGAMRELVERQTGGAPCLFLQGASGELAPREQYTGDTAIADANGRQLGYAVLATLESMLPPRTRLSYGGVVESGAPLADWRRLPFEPSCTVAARQVEVELPLKPLPTREELLAEMNKCEDRVLVERIRRKLRVIDAVGSGPTCRMPAWIWRVGDIVFLGQPNEAYSRFQMTLRESFPNHAIVIMNLVNGSCGYLSPPELQQKDIYQVWQSPFSGEALPSLINACRQHLNDALAHR